MAEQRQYDEEYKVQAIKLAKKIGAVKAANIQALNIMPLSINSA